MYISILNFHPATPYLVQRAYRSVSPNAIAILFQVTSVSNLFRKAENIFPKTKLPFDILSEAVQKASNLTFAGALNTKTTDSQDTVPFVRTCILSLPYIGKIIKQYWGLLEISASQSVGHLHTCKCKPIVVYKRQIFMIC